MSASTKITVRLDETIKTQLEIIFEDLGMNLSTGINILAKAVVRYGGFPFELSDPFFSAKNQARIALSKKQIADGRVIYKTDADLGLDEDE